MIKKLLFSSLLILATLVSWAETVYIDSDAAAGGDGKIDTPFKTIADAYASVEAGAEIGENVMFIIEDGIYEEKIILDVSLLQNLGNTITFKSASGDPTKCVIKGEITTDADDALFLLKGMSNVSFDGLGFETTGSRGYCIRFAYAVNGINNINVKNCRFYRDSYDYNGAIFKSYNDDCYNLNIEDCYFEKIKALTQTGNTTNKTGTVFFRNNTLKNSGLTVQYMNETLVIENNTIEATSVTQVINLNNTKNALINSNYIKINDENVGIYLNYCSNTNINNNIIDVLKAAIYSKSSTGTNIFHNTFKAHEGAESAIVTLSTDTDRATIANNILFTKNSFPLSIASFDNIVSSDNNVYYTLHNIAKAGTGEYTTLENWQAESTFDANSVFADPLFKSDTDLTPQNKAIKGIGQDLMTIVSLDKNGLERSATPDPGAVEFIPNEPLAGVYIIDPAGGVFKTIAEAVQALNTSGTSADVTFEITAATYNEANLTISYSQGNKVTFLGKGTTPSETEIAYDFADADPVKNLFFIDNSKNISFDNISFTATGATQLIEFSQSADNITINNCKFHVAADDATCRMLEFRATSPNASRGITNITVTNSEFHSSLIAFRLFTTAGEARPNDSITIRSNRFYESHGHDIKLTSSNNVTITDNWFERSTMQTATYNSIVNLEECGTTSIQRNTIYATHDNAIGFYFKTPQTSIQERVDVFNNSVNLPNGGKGIFFDYLEGQVTLNILHNTVRSKDLALAFTQSSTSTQVLAAVENNILAVDEGMTVLQIDPAISYLINSNCYFNGNSGTIALLHEDARATVVELQATGGDANAVVTDPQFKAEKILTPMSFALNDKVNRHSSVSQDLNGTTRGATTDYGAVEYGFVPLEGEYTIAKDGSVDFKSIAYVAEYLREIGATGDVIFNIKADTYTEQVTCDYNTGYQVTFQSLTGDKDVMVAFNSIESTKNYVFSLGKNCNTTLKNLTLKSLGLENEFKRVIFLVQDASDIIISDCIITTECPAGAQYLVECGAESGKAINSISIRNSEFLASGQLFIKLNGGSSAALSEGLSIDNNLFITDQPSATTNAFISIDYSLSPFVKHNIFRQKGDFSDSRTFIYIHRNAGSPTIAYNQVYSTASITGVKIQGLETPIDTPPYIAYIYNNVFNVGGNGINTSSVDSAIICHNSIKTGNTSAIGSGYSSLNIFNNIFVYEANVCINDGYGNSKFNTRNNIYGYNSIYTSYPVRNSTYYTLTELQAQGFDLNSQLFIPSFKDSTLLPTPLNGYIDNIGEANTIAGDDLNLTNRHISTPDAGAYEFDAEDIMAGEYIIDPGSTGDFLSVAEAVTALKTRGMSAAVVFSIKPATYYGQYDLTAIPGLSEENTLTFTSFAQDNSTVILQHTVPTNGTNYIFHLNGANNITFSHLSAKVLSDDTPWDVSVFQLEEGTENITIDNCDISAETGRNSYLIYSKTSIGKAIITNNTLTNTLGQAIKIVSNDQAQEASVIKDNTISTSYLSIDVSSAKNILVENNTIVSGNSNAIAIQKTDGASLINNTINDASTAISITNCKNEINLIDNNIVSSTGIESSTTEEQTVIIEGSEIAASSYGIKTTGTDSLIIRNNLIECTGNTGLAVTGARSALTETNTISGLYFGINSSEMIGSHKIVNNKISTLNNGSYYSGISITSTQENNDTIANNLVNSKGNGMRLNTNNNIVLVHNTFKCGRDGLYSNDSNAKDVKLKSHNNIFHMTGLSGYLVNVQGEVIWTSIGSSNNVIWSENLDKLVNYKTLGEIDLTQWQGLNFEKDAVLKAPRYISETDLHLAPENAEIDNKGILIDFVSYDIDGELRSTITPDVGADEFEAAELMGGTYIIDQTGNGDYESIPEAYADLKKGMSQEVIFQIVGETYNGQITFSEDILGGSPLYPVTFEAFNEEEVYVEYDLQTAENNYVVKVDGVKNLHFKNIIFHSSSSNANHTVLNITNGAKDVTFTGCSFTKTQSMNSNDDLVLINSTSTTLGVDNITFDYCYFNAQNLLANDKAIQIETPSTGDIDILHKNITISNSTFEHTSNAIYIYEYGGVANLNISGNTFEMREESAERAMYIGAVSGEIVINANKVNWDSSTSTPIYRYQTVRTLAGYPNSETITNNMIFAPLASAITFSICTDILLAHNTIVASGNCVKISNKVDNPVKNFNNIIKSYSSQACFAVSNKDLLESNHNIYFNTDETRVAAVGLENYSLEEWKDLEFGVNSVYAKPEFISGTDLHLSANNPALDNLGTMLSTVPFDIDNEERDPQTPDIGADEFTAGEAFTVDLGADTVVCNATELVLNSNIADATYEWCTGEVTQEIIAIESKEYSVTVTKGGITVEDTMIVTFSTAPEVSLDDTLRVCEASEVTLSVGGTDSYTWSDGIEEGIAFIPEISQDYYVEAKNTDGCITKDSIYVKIHPTIIASETVMDASCGGKDGSITIDADPELEFVWAGDTLFGQTIENLPADSYTVTVTDNICETVIKDIIVDEAGAPTVTISEFTKPCQGDSIILEAITEASQILWFDADDKIISENAWAKVASQTATTFKAKAIEDGCSSTAIADFEVNKKPILNIEDTIKICELSKVALSGGGTDKYVWSGGIEDGVEFTPEVSITYYVTATNEALCTTDDSIHVEVHIPFTFEVEVTEPSCGSIDGKITATTTPEGEYEFIWGQFTAEEATPNILYPIGKGTYPLTISNQICTLTTEVEVKEQGASVLSIDELIEICPGDEITLEPTTDAKELTWKTGDAIIDEAALTLKVAPVETTEYVIVASNGICESTDTVTVEILEKPFIPTDEIISQDICAGEIFSFETTPIGKYVKQEWYLGESLISEEGLLKFEEATVENSGSYTLVVNNQCGADTVKNLVNLTVVPIPETFAGEDAAICLGDSLMLEATGAEEYYWDMGTQGSYFTPTETTTLNVTGKNKGLCKLDDDITITVNPLPVITMPETLEVAENKTVLITVDELYSDYTWSTGEKTKEIIVSEEGYYKLTVTDENGCKATDSVYVEQVAGFVAELNIISEEVIIDKDNYKSISVKTNLNNYTWTSSNPEVAEAILGDLVLAKGIGFAWIYAENTEYEIIDSVKITVPEEYIPVEMLVLPATKGVLIGEELSLAANFIPSDASFKDILWKSSDESIATVDQNGNVVAKAEGICNIIALSLDNNTPTICALGVSATPQEPENVYVQESLELEKGDYHHLGAFIDPIYTTEADLYYISLNPEIVSTTENGILHAKSDGVAQVLVKIKNTNIVAKARIVVSDDKAPHMTQDFSLTISSERQETSFNPADYFADDKTSFKNLVFDFTATENLSISYNEGIVTVINVNEAFAGKESLVATVSDSTGHTSKFNIDVLVSNKANSAPAVSVPNLYSKTTDGKISVQLDKFINDDFTLEENITWSVTSGTKAIVSITNDILYVNSAHPNVPVIETIFITATDEHGESTTIPVEFTSVQKENKAPIILELPEIVEKDGVFTPIDLNKYVQDDYSSEADIEWLTIPSDKLTAKIVDQKLYIEVVDKFWSGTAPLTLIAQDDMGQVSETELMVVKQNPEMEYWNGKPLTMISTSTMITTPVSPVTFYANMYGVQSWAWEIEGTTPSTSYDISPKVIFNEIGEYSAKLTTMNIENGTLSETVTTLETPITVIGITPRESRLCQDSDSLELSIEDGYGPYTWSNSDQGNTTKVKPEEPTYFKIEFTAGLHTLTDSVLVEVATPVNLTNDTAICANTELVLDAGDYYAYSWSNGSTEQNISVNEAGKYTVTVVDEYLCMSIDSMKITELYAVPSIPLEASSSLCDTETKVLDAGEFTSYAWSTGETTQTISVTETDNYSVTVTNENACINTATSEVTFTKPYPEQIGLATYSETENAVVVAWNRTPGKRTERYELWREDGGVDQYIKIADRLYTDSLYVVDEYANAIQQSYKYKLITVDSTCGNSAESNPHRTIHLMQNSGLNSNVVNLSWSDYIGNPVDEYLIYRVIDGEKEQIGTTIFGGSNSFTYSFHEPGYSYRVGYKLSDTLQLSQLKTNTGPYSHSISNIAEIDIVNTEELLSGIAIFPLPAKDKLYITSENTDEYTATLLTATGQTVFSEYFEDKTEIDISTIPAGTYLLKIIANGKVATQTIIKE